MSRFTAGLTPNQIAIVIGIFWFTAIGAIVAALVFRWVNVRR